MNTIIYLGSSKAIHDFDWMQEENILHKQVKEKLTELEFSNLVKTDLRNANLDYLIIDACILEKNNLNSYRQGIETFQILNPDCQVILYANEEIIMQGEIKGVVVISEPGQAFLLPEQKDIPGQIVEKEQSGILEIEEEQENVREESISTEPATDILNDGINEISESEGFTEPTQVPDEENRNSLDIFSRMNVKVKTSEGIPLKERCLEQQKVTEKENIQLLTTLNNIWTCSNVIIAVVGTQRRTGTTTTAIRLCNYLDSCGAKVCYSEAVLDGNKHLESIAEEFGFQVLADGYRKENIMFFLESQYDTESGYNFIILDLGAVDERSKWISAVLEQIADEVIVVSSGSRKYEVDCLKQSIEALSGLTIRINIVLNLVNENELEKFLEYQENERVVLHQGQHEPGLFVSTRTEEEIVRVLSEHNV